MKKTNSTEIRSKPVSSVSNRQSGFRLIFEHLDAVRRLLVVFFMIWFSMLLIYGVTSNVMNEFYRFIFFLRHPVVIVLNGATLVAACAHTFCWFSGGRKEGTSVFPRYRKMIQGWAGIFLAAIIAVFLFYMISR